MRKTETTLETLLEDIKRFYDAKTWHFVTMNGLAIDEETIELQWIFSKYGAKDEILAFFLLCGLDAKVPSIVSLIPSAIMGEREVVDMFGLDVEDAQKGLYLDDDSLQNPLRKEA